MSCSEGVEICEIALFSVNCFRKIAITFTAKIEAWDEFLQLIMAERKPESQ